MTGLLTDKVAIVTGAGQGVGEGIARALADAGAAVVIAARRAENGEPAAAALRERGHEASFVRCDVTLEIDLIDCCSPRRSSRTDESGIACLK